jgi:hypothetical protein
VSLIVVLAAGAASADYVIVKPDGSGTYPTIQEAVDAASDDDSVILTDGTFAGDGNRDIEVPARHIVISSQSNDFMACQIDCGGSAREPHRGFHFNSTAGRLGAELHGIGIINGYMTDGGGGIWVEGQNLAMSDCAVAFCTVDNPSGKGGGLLATDGADLYALRCLFALNSAGYGGGVAFDQAYGELYLCELSDNTATDVGGGLYVNTDDPFQANSCDIVSNEAPVGGGVWLSGGEAYIESSNVSRNHATDGPAGGVLLHGGFLVNSTCVENSATEGGAGAHGDGATGKIRGSIIAFSQSGYGVGAVSGYPPIIECSDVFGNPAGEYDPIVGDQTGANDNFSQDPEICDMEAEDYRLFNTSPCTADHSPCGYQVGRYGVGCDDPVEKTGWGRLKSLYR